MKVDKKTEAEVLQVYKTWLDGYLNADAKTYDFYFDDDFHFIGSTSNEEFLNRKETTEFFIATGDQLSGKTDLRNETKIIEQFGDLIFITHLFDAWFLNGCDWVLYGRFRFTNALQKKEQGWRFIYQHYSLPDTKAQEGETIGYDQISAENLQLREAIKRRTLELEVKNRELEVEGALERIRAQAVAMRSSTDLLDIVVSMRKEFTKLGHEAHYFWHMMWLPDTYEKAMTSGDGTKIGFVMELPRHIHGNIPLLANWEKSKKATVVYPMNVEEAIDYVEKMVQLGNFQNIDPQAPSNDDIKHIGGLTFVMARTTHGEIGYSLPGIVKNPPKEDLDILRQFASAFDLAHRRFLDLQKAEKQARETQVELSLERIRSRVTAMQKASDLFDIVVCMRNEFISLGHQADYFWHMKWLDDGYEMFMTAEDGGRLGMAITIPKFVHDQIDSLHLWEQSKDPYFVLALDAKQAWNYLEAMNTHGHYKQADPNAPTEEDILHLDGLTFVMARTTHGEIGFSLAGQVPNPPEESIGLLIRFASVFDLAYKRFEDLENAEAQAREVQIELALEKVRSRTMAMHKSLELKEVVKEIFEQMAKLNINADHAGIVVDFEPKKDFHIWVADHRNTPAKLTLPYLDLPWDQQYTEAKKKGKSFFTTQLNFEEKNDFYKTLLPHIEGITKESKEFYLNCPGLQISTVLQNNIGLYIENFKGEPFSEEDNLILKRFGKVFQQTYIRFLDLQKAEAQTRDAQINLAVERVRAKALAMHKSDEIMEVVAKLKEEVMSLDIPDVVAATIFLKEGEDKVRMWDLSTLEKNNNGYQIPFDITFKLKKTDPNLYVKRVWENPEDYFLEVQKAKDFKRIVAWLRENDKEDIADEVEDYTKSTNLEVLHHAVKKLNNGKLVIDLLHPPSNEMQTILTKMGAAFDLAYKRFEDLQNAEAQTREAQIEAALEKVRSRSLAMQSADELGNVVLVIVEKLKDLGVILDANGITLCTYFPNSKDILHWIASPDFSHVGKHLLPYFDHVILREAWASKEKGEAYFSKSYSINEKNTFFEHAFEHSDYKYFPEEFKQWIFNNDQHSLSFAWQKNSALLIPSNTGNLFTDKERDILIRFSKVFEQAYVRFMDLQKSEKQAREAKIEAALEKVRSRTMAMQHSQELPEAANILFTEVQNLGIPAWSCGYNILSEDRTSSTCIMSSEGEIQTPFVLPLTQHESLKPWHNAILGNEEFFVYEQGDSDLAEHYEYMQSLPDLKETFQQLSEADISLPNFQVNHLAKFTNGFLLFITYERVPEAHQIFKRFAKVFEQTYTRFLDLKKAEAQAREAQIEAALERVRSKTMAMHNSQDMESTVITLFKEVSQLDLDKTIRCGIGILEHNGDTMETYSATSNPDGSVDLKNGVLKMNAHIMLSEIRNAWKQGKSNFQYHFDSVELRTYYKALNEEPNYPFDRNLETLPDHEYQRGFFFNEGLLFAFTTNPISDESAKILSRFAAVFGQTYTRYLDLRKAEKRAREAQIEMALEKVRSRTMAMESSKELAETSVIVFTQLLELGISPNRLFIGIVNKEENAIEAWATNEDGSKIEQHFELFTSENKTIKKMVDGWKKNLKSNVIDLKGKELQDYFHYLNKVMNIPFIDGLKQKRRVQTIAYFSGGLIGMAAPDEQPKETLELMQRFAAVFNLTYTRFKDLKIAEANTIKAEKDLIKLKASKKRAEKALSELQQTQKQLIQSEKMASLGELTAGIAHEIQNPLNFVNNFSEVSKELIEEMLEEIANGDTEEVKAIARDLFQNLEKINHHGQRADGIVKGMLQHSRSNSAEKELTDINKLADEYLRLAYHGLRAKDKSFNATLVTDYDASIGKVTVIPQDIGRVILNLITNAFYVVGEKKKSGIDGYQPKVIVSTKRLRDNITIAIKDNGNGIPKHILDKIFQPFFTTKPTGQGTGLGLSMSYDIVTKGHGGELRVETKQDQGTEFTIVLPKLMSTN